MLRILLFLIGLLFPILSEASFIETTMGTAVLNDATAAYYNPSALTLLKNTQIIPLGTVARFRTKFTGQSTAILPNATESGTSRSVSYYYSPSFYVGVPVGDRVTLGLAVVSNFATRDPEDNSILRYVQSSNTIQDYDVVGSLGIKLNDYFSFGGGVNFSYLQFDLQPVTGFPGSNIPDSQSDNQSDGYGLGGNVGFLWKPKNGTLVGFNYRTITTYEESGTSTFNGTTQVVSRNYQFELRTPARSVLSISQSITPQLGFISTLQRIQWSIIRNVNIEGIATASGNTPLITRASVPYYLHDTWVFTVGGNYQFNPQWIARVAGTYNPSPSNGNDQVSTGNSYILGGSLGYKINKTITLDGSYAHAFIQDETINIRGSRFLINGTHQASRDVVSLKMTFNM